MEQQEQANRNGRNGSLTSWDNKARDYFKSLYSLYSQFKQSIYLEDTDINTLLGYYKKKDKLHREQIKILKRFLLNEFKLMGYPQEKKENYNGYIQTQHKLIILNFGLNEQNINRIMFNDYFNFNSHNQKMKGGISKYGEDIYTSE